MAAEALPDDVTGVYLASIISFSLASIRFWATCFFNTAGGAERWLQSFNLQRSQVVFTNTTGTFISFQNCTLFIKSLVIRKPMVTLLLV